MEMHVVGSMPIGVVIKVIKESVEGEEVQYGYLLNDSYRMLKMFRQYKSC